VGSVEFLLNDFFEAFMPQSASPRPEHRDSIPIAIVGMSGLFPQAEDLRQLWQNILNRVDAIREVPEERWREADYFDSDRLAADKIYSKWGGFLDPIRFDPMKWKIPPASLASIDPMQLLSLEVADRAFADAGYDHRPFPKERTGVIFACAGTNDVGSDYAFRTMISHHLPRMKGISDDIREKVVEETHALMPEWTEDSFPGILTNVIAGRIANRFDLGGPNFTVDAACAASLAALYSAIAQLRVGTVDMMLVGAADGSNNAFTYMCFAKTHALSPRGRSRPFDDSADGIALGEGIAAILIKRLDDALRDGDKIYAVIRGIGSSSDGRNRSLTAPHPGGQILALQRAYADANLPCASISSGPPRNRNVGR
jgi:acyl transferase domain-containing protein